MTLLAALVSDATPDAAFAWLCRRLAGHTFDHEIAYAVTNGIFWSIDINRGNPLLGLDTDQFPNNVAELTLALFRILKSGGISKRRWTSVTRAGMMGSDGLLSTMGCARAPPRSARQEALEDLLNRYE